MATESDSETLKNFKKELNANIEIYFHHSFIHKYVLFLDPKYKELNHVNSDEKKEILKAVEEEISK